MMKYLLNSILLLICLAACQDHSVHQGSVQQFQKDQLIHQISYASTAATNSKERSAQTENTYCTYPKTPKIKELTCNSKEDAAWKFKVDHIDDEYQIRWYAKHAIVLSGQGTDEVVISPYSSVEGSFTLYCEVSKKCINSLDLVKTKTAYYSNTYGGSCGKGSTGILNTTGRSVSFD